MIKVVSAAALLAAILSTSVLAADGKTLFANSCALCHQVGGVGAPGLAPPLADKALWDRLGEKAPAYIAGVMLAGFSGTIEVAGVTYSGLIMPPQDQMTDEELAAIGNYVLATLNKSGQQVLAPDVAKRRSAPLSHAQLRALRRTGQ